MTCKCFSLDLMSRSALNHLHEILNEKHMADEMEACSATGIFIASMACCAAKFNRIRLMFFYS